MASKWTDRSYWTDDVLLKELREAEEWLREAKGESVLSRTLKRSVGNAQDRVRLLSAEASRRGLI